MNHNVNLNNMSDVREIQAKYPSNTGWFMEVISSELTPTERPCSDFPRITPPSKFGNHWHTHAHTQKHKNARTSQHSVWLHVVTHCNDGLQIGYKCAVSWQWTSMLVGPGQEYTGEMRSLKVASTQIRKELETRQFCDKTSNLRSDITQQHEWKDILQWKMSRLCNGKSRLAEIYFDHI